MTFRRGHSGPRMPMQTRTPLQLVASTAAIGVICVAFGASARMREPAPQATAPTVGQSVGKAIDEAIAQSRAWSTSAAAWLKRTAADRRAEVARRLELAKAAAPEPEVGVRLVTLDAATNAPIESAIENVKDVPATLIILVHGFNEPGGIFDDLAPALIAQGHRVAAFHYPNDQEIAASAELFGESLARLRARGVTRVAFVAHSMGGLITRDVLTSKEFYNGAGTGHPHLPDAARFIMVDTPNIGSNLARVAWISEARESLVRWANSDSKDPAIFLGALKDGNGEAAKDLLPGSAYLTDLNVRPLPKDVPITAIVGLAGEDAGGGLAEFVAAAASRKWIDDSQAHAARAAIDNAIKDFGDGVVSEATQVPDGVTDIVRAAGFHRTILKTLEVEKSVRDATGAKPKVATAIPVIVERLADFEKMPSNAAHKR